LVISQHGEYRKLLRPGPIKADIVILAIKKPGMPNVMGRIAEYDKLQLPYLTY